MKPALHRAAFGVDLLLQLARQDHVLQRRQLRLAQVDALLELVEHAGQIRDLRADPVALTPGPPRGGSRSKLNSRLSMLGHLGEALAERIQADHVGVHLAQAHGHRVHAQLQLQL